MANDTRRAHGGRCGPDDQPPRGGRDEPARTRREEGVPLGSTYHFFPGGKAALVDEAVNYVGDQVAGQHRGDARGRAPNTSSGGSCTRGDAS